jgi:3-hydroxyacyl-CoA dehydrogenase
VTRTAVIGCGTNGSGITFVARAAGFPVAVEPSDELVAAARRRVERLEVQAEKRDARVGSTYCAAPALLRRMVEDGKLGRKSGAGSYDY